MDDKYNAGDYEGAQRASENSYRWSKISILVGVMMLVVNVVLAIITVILGAASSAASYSS